MKNLTKRVIGILISSAMLLTSPVVYADEVTEFTEFTLPEYTVEAPSADFGVTNDELLLGYFENQLYDIEGGISTFAVAGSSSLTGDNKKIYDELKAGAIEIANGQRTSTVISVDLEWSFSELGIADDAYFTADDYTALNAKIDALDLKGEMIHLLLRDCPYEFYWYNSTESTPISVGDNSSISQVDRVVKYNYKVSFPVSADYSGGSAYTVNTAKTSAATAAATKAKSIVSAAAGKSDYEKLVYYKEQICSLVEYNNTAAGKNYDISVSGISPWQLIYVFDGNSSTNVVCEGYAKAFQYLCDLTDFRGDVACYCATGMMTTTSGSSTSGGGHMWNIVRINGNSYLVDVTNCDGNSIGNPDKLFLKGMVADASNYRLYTISFTTAGGSNCKIKYEYDTATTSEGVRLTETEDNLGRTIMAISSEDYVEEEVETIDISTLTVSAIPDQTYAGSAITPSVTIKDGSTTLTNGTHYTVSYSNNTNAGTATVTITGKGNYTGTKSVTFKIVAKSISGATLSAIANQTYTGVVIKPSVTVKDGSVSLTNNTHYTISYSNNVNVGTATVTITGKGNYTGTKSTTFGITAKSISGATLSAIANQTYTGSAIKPSVTVKDGSTTLTNGSHYTVTYSNNTNIGTATVTVTGKGNYTGTKSTTFSIVGKSISSAGVSSISNQVYTGSPITPAVTVTLNSVQLVKDKDYIIAYTNNTSVGTATVNITGIGTYSGTRSITFRITAKNVSGLTVTPISSMVYTGSALSPAVTVKDGSKTLTKGTDYTVSYSANINAGTGNAVITGKGNYTGTRTVNFTITPASISNATIAAIPNIAYTGTAQKPLLTVKYGSTTLTVGTHYTATYSNNTNVGTATVTITGIGNYGGTKTANFKITAKSISSATISTIADQTYTGSTIKPSVTVKDGSTTLTNGTHYTATYSNNTNVGTATLTITGIGEYSGTRTSTFRIVAKSISGVTISAIADQTYTGSAITPAITVKDGSTTLTNGTHYTVSYSNNTNVGTATVTITGKSNYTGTKTTTFKIVAKTITTPAITVTPGNGQATVKWNAVSGATMYAAFYRVNGTSAWTQKTTTATSYTFTGLKNGTKYDFLVIAYNGSAWSTWTNSNIVNATPVGSGSSAFGTPAITVTPGNGQATVKWNAVSGATMYAAFYRVNGTSAWTQKTTTATSCTFTGLKNGTKYDFLVIAYNGSAWSTWTNSNIVNATPVGSGSSSFGTPAITVTPGNGQATVKWNAVSGATMYAAFYRVNGTSAWTQKTTTATSYTFTGLKNGTKYDFLVIAYNGSAWSTWTNSNVVNATPVGSGSSSFGTPAITVTPGNGQATVKWNAVSGATMYAAFYRVNGTSAWTQKTTTATSCTFTGLKNGTKYDFLVIAYNGSAWSTWTNSNVVNATPVGSGSSSFGTPAITVTPGNGQATVKWNAVSGATMYAAFYRVNGTSAWTQKTTTATSCTFTGLKNGTKYDFLVIAYNGSVWSAWTNSNIVNATL